MSHQRIMYVCSDCADGNPEGCGHYDRCDLRVLPDGRWLCESCFDDTDQIERGNHDEDAYKHWGDLPMPPEYAVSSPDRRGEP
jgi:hypothetical protein